MKTKKLLLTISAVLLLSACSSGDGDSVERSKPDPNSDNTSINANKNTSGPIEAQTQLEFPHLKKGIVLVHRAILNKNINEEGLNYCVEWDTDLQSQRWSCYKIYSSIKYHSSYNVKRYSAENDGTLSPTCQYPNDPQLPAEYQFTTDPYKYSGYDHGHICPSADRQRATDCNYQTFFITNMQPQYSKFNAGLWQEMEDDVRNWVSMSDTLYICKGGTIDNSEYILEYVYQRSHQSTRVNKDHIPVPRFFYMALLSRKNNTWQAMAYWAQNLNEDHSKDTRKGYAITIDRLEELTGIDFFCNLPDNIEDEVESKVTHSYWFK